MLKKRGRKQGYSSPDS